jgi:hypothetical protein
MQSYLLAINPRHKDLIRSIQLRLSMTRRSPNLSRKALLTLATLPGLRYLEIDVDVDYYLCSPIGPRTGMQRTMEVGEEELRMVRECKHWEAFGEGLWGCELVFRVPWHYFHKKLDIELRNWEMVDGEGRETRYGETGDAVRRVVCVDDAPMKRGLPVACASLSRRALHVGRGHKSILLGSAKCAQQSIKSTQVVM